VKTAKEVREYMKKKKRKRGKKKPWVSFKEGTYYLRIGPPWKKKGEVWKDILFHGGWKNKVYCAKNDIDPETGKQRKCKVCRRLVELKTDRSKRGKKLWSLINQRSEGLWNVLIARVKKRHGKLIVRRYRDNKFHIWRGSYKWHMALVDIFSDDDYREKSILGVTHPKYGRLIKLRREGSGRDDTSYVFRVMDKSSPISKDEEKREELLGTLVNLDKVVHGSSDEELSSFLRKMEKKAKLLARRDEEEDEDEDADDVDEDDDRPKKKKHRRDEEEDEEDDEDEEDEEDDGDDGDDDLDSQYKKMKKHYKKKKRREEEDDDDEDEEDEDED